jgi:hypothetical protein
MQSMMRNEQSCFLEATEQTNPKYLHPYIIMQTSPNQILHGFKQTTKVTRAQQMPDVHSVDETVVITRVELISIKSLFGYVGMLHFKHNLHLHLRSTSSKGPTVYKEFCHVKC